MIGERSKIHGEIKASIYLFPTLTDVADALGQWLGIQFDDYEQLALLEVSVQNPNPQEVEWEITCDSKICPENIKVLYEDLDTIIDLPTLKIA
jgi:hypothetical protein